MRNEDTYHSQKNGENPQQVPNSAKDVDRGAGARNSHQRHITLVPPNLVDTRAFYQANEG